MNVIYFVLFFSYNKTENLEPGGKEMLQYSHLLITPDDQRELELYRSSHILLKTIEGFIKLRFNPSAMPPLEILTASKTYILKNIIQRKDVPKE